MRNVPQSIVEYRPEAQIRAYIRNPLTFRYGAMPPHPHLDDRRARGRGLAAGPQLQRARVGRVVQLHAALHRLVGRRVGVRAQVRGAHARARAELPRPRVVRHGLRGARSPPDRARELFTMAADAATGKTKPVMRMHDCRMLTIIETMKIRKNLLVGVYS